MDFKLVLRVRKLWLQVQKVNGLVGIFFFFLAFLLASQFYSFESLCEPIRGSLSPEMRCEN